jgi:hypothetical protein
MSRSADPANLSTHAPALRSLPSRPIPLLLVSADWLVHVSLQGHQFSSRSLIFSIVNQQVRLVGMPRYRPRSVNKYVPKQTTGPPCLYYENVAPPKSVWKTISRLYYGIQTEFVNMKFVMFAALGSSIPSPLSAAELKQVQVAEVRGDHTHLICS